MTERFIPGVPCWADAMYPDPEAAMEFYSGLFGWECEDVMPEGAPGTYAMCRIGGGDVVAISSTFDDGSAPSEPAWLTYVKVEDVDKTAAVAAEAGANVFMEPMDVGDGSARIAVFADPQGAVLGIEQPKDHKGSDVVNEHGAVNFNDLVTTDLDGAAAFYGTVFGWDVFEMGPGGRFWTMTAYGDHLETLNPGMRAQMAEMGAPGFENVVATLGEATDGTPAHWGITFATEDVEATVARAGELGATIVSPPTDAAWVRFAVIRDPQGAVFTASQFVPENAQPAG